MSTPGEAVLERVRRHREEAATMEAYAPEVARVLRAAAEQYERDVLAHTPEWWTLAAVQAAKGWTARTLHRMAARLEARGQARRGAAGRWEFRWDAVYAMRSSPRQLQELEVGADLSALAETLAGES